LVITKLAYGGLIWIVLLLGAAVTAAATIGPKAQVPETTHDFGEVFEDRQLTYTFGIKNIGEALLEIKDIDSDCAGAAVRLLHRPGAIRLPGHRPGPPGLVSLGWLAGWPRGNRPHITTESRVNP
jgi:hypothetical protein